MALCLRIEQDLDVGCRDESPSFKKIFDQLMFEPTSFDN